MNKLDTVCDELLKVEMEKRGFIVCSKPQNIDAWKRENKIIEIEEFGGYHYIGETKDFSEEEFRNTVREFAEFDQDDPIDICKEYFKLKIVGPFMIDGTIHNQSLEQCGKDEVGAIEVWGTID
ncbi:MAG: hypothetical protein ACRC4T_08110 [Cetobacterium sp.]